MSICLLLMTDYLYTKFGLIWIKKTKATEGGGGAESAPQVENILNRPGEIGLNLSICFGIKLVWLFSLIIDATQKVCTSLSKDYNMLTIISYQYLSKSKKNVIKLKVPATVPQQFKPNSQQAFKLFHTVFKSKAQGSFVKSSDYICNKFKVNQQHITVSP